MKSSPVFHAAVCVLSGAAYGLGYQLIGWGPLAWVSIAPALWVCGRSRPGQAFLYGWLFGAVSFAAGCPWVTSTIAQFLNLPMAPAAALFGVFALGEGLQFALALGLARWAAEGLQLRLGLSIPSALALAVPPFWVAVEWLYPEQFPKYTAMTQLFHLPLVQSLDLFGTAWLAWLVCGFNAALYAAFCDRRARRALAAMVLLAAANEGYGLLRIRQVDAEVARKFQNGDVIKIGIPQGAQTLQERASDAKFPLYVSLTDLALKNAPLDLVIWPESAFAPEVLGAGGPEGLSNPTLDGIPLQEALRVRLPERTHILLNGKADAPSASRLRSFNASLLTGPDREFLGAALKRHLFPFGEYMPLADRFPILLRYSPRSSSYTRGRGHDVLRMEDGTRLGILICYEDLLPVYVRASVRKGVDILVEQSSDIWFPGRLPYFHLHAGSLRAIENRKFMVRAVESGISAMVDPVGRVTRSLAFGVRGAMTAQAARMGDDTLYSRIGDVFYFAAALLSLGLLILRLSPIR